VAGWLQGQLVVRPILRRFMREHTRKLKGTIEELPSSALSGRRRE